MAIKFNQSDLSWALKNFPGIAGVFDDDLALLQFSTMAHRIDQDAPWWKDYQANFKAVVDELRNRPASVEKCRFLVGAVMMFRAFQSGS